jgi:hypothetical protein
VTRYGVRIAAFCRFITRCEVVSAVLLAAGHHGLDRLGFHLAGNDGLGIRAGGGEDEGAGSKYDRLHSQSPCVW